MTINQLALIIGLFAFCGMPHTTVAINEGEMGGELGGGPAPLSTYGDVLQHMKFELEDNAQFKKQFIKSDINKDDGKGKILAVVLGCFAAVAIKLIYEERDWFKEQFVACKNYCLGIVPEKDIQEKKDNQVLFI